MEQHLRADGVRFRGVRNRTAQHVSPEINWNPVPPRSGLLSEPAFRRGLSLDVWNCHTQLDEVADLARALPHLTLVLNYCSGPLGAGPYTGRRAEILSEWGGRMRTLAGCPNVMVKLGGLGMAVGGFGFEWGDLPPSSSALKAAWRPYLETCVDAFSADRCMFKSNFPVGRGSTSYVAL